MEQENTVAELKPADSTTAQVKSLLAFAGALGYRVTLSFRGVSFVNAMNQSDRISFHSMELLHNKNYYVFFDGNSTVVKIGGKKYYNLSPVEIEMAISLRLVEKINLTITRDRKEIFSSTKGWIKILHPSVYYALGI